MGNPAGVRRDFVGLEQRRREAAELLHWIVAVPTDITDGAQAGSMHPGSPVDASRGVCIYAACLYTPPLRHIARTSMNTGYNSYHMRSDRVISGG